MWDNAKNIYDYVNQNNIYVEDLDIQLHVYVFPMTSELLTYCKDNSYRIDIFKDTIMSYQHYDFTYTDIDSVEWVTNCTEETGFSVGTCAAAGFNFSIFSEKYLDNGSEITYDKTEFKRAVVIPVYDFAHDNNMIVQKQLGVFHVTDYEKDTDMIDFTCLDNMQFLDKKAKGIQKLISVPLKSSALVGNIISILNLAEGPTPVIVKHFRINQVDHLKKLTYRTILSYAMEAIGCYAFANHIGEICYKFFSASAKPVATILYDDVMEGKSKGNGVKINGYEIQYGDNAVSAFSYMAGEEVVEVPVPLTVDNPLFIKKKTESLDIIGTRLFDMMYGFSFDPYEVTTFLPNFYIEAGDFVNVQDKYGEIHKILVSQLTWRDNLEMEIISACETGSADGDYDSDVNEAIQRNGNIDCVPIDDDSEEEEQTVAEFTFTGEQFNSAVKTVANDTDKAYSESDSVVKVIEFTNIPPSDGDVSKTLKESTNGYTLTVYTTSGDKSTVKMYSDADILILAKNMSEMFYRFYSLTSVDLSRFDTSKVTNMMDMFNRCQSLTELDLSNFDTSSVTNMSAMFDSCSVLRELNLSNFDTSNVTNMERMFEYCTNITSIDLSNFNTISAEEMYQMFYRCTGLTSLDLSSFTTSESTNMGQMFGYCTSLRTIKVSSDKWVLSSKSYQPMIGCGATFEYV